MGARSDNDKMTPTASRRIRHTLAFWYQWNLSSFIFPFSIAFCTSWGQGWVGVYASRLWRSGGLRWALDWIECWTVWLVSLEEKEKKRICIFLRGSQSLGTNNRSHSHYDTSANIRVSRTIVCHNLCTVSYSLVSQIPYCRLRTWKWARPTRACLRLENLFYTIRTGNLFVWSCCLNKSVKTITPIVLID